MSTRRGLLALVAALMSACSAGGGGAPPATAAAPFALELVVRTPAALRTRADVDALVAAAARQGFGTVSVLVKQDEDGPGVVSGQLYVPGTLAPVAPGYGNFDVLQATLDAARPRGLKVRAWLPQFHDQVAAKMNPAWAMRALVGGTVQPYTGSRSTEYFVNPLDAAVQDHQLAIVRDVATRYAVDGVMLDWIRFDDFAMDLGDATRARYRALTGIDPATIDFRSDNAERRRWNDFRTEAIARYTARVRAALPAGMALGVYILPPEFVEVGQDAARFAAHVQQLAPMCYFRDWGYPIEWLWTSCLPSTMAKAGATPVAPTLDARLPDDEVQRIVAKLRADFPGVRTLVWFEHEQWTEANLARLARLSNPP
ncbi:MAG: family 10 glycosylhydrolase [Rubrivivax sp.]|nr:family 10 glycosylhydrolase [Rubrivivax sp.]